MKIKLSLAKGDVFLVVLTVIIIGVFFLWNGMIVEGKQDDSGADLCAYIVVDGKLQKVINLSELRSTETIELDDVNMTVQAKRGKIRVKSSDCPDKICVQAGWLTEPEDIAVCMPNKTFVAVKEILEDERNTGTP